MENKLYSGIINSGKTQKIINDVKEKINNNESMLILDSKGEYKELFKGYEIIEFDMNNLDNFYGYNPFYESTLLYKDGKIDESIGVIINIGNKIFITKDELDPFWNNNAKTLYTSICLYLLETNNELNIKEIIKVAVANFDEFKEYVEKQDILSTISILGTPVLNSPTETRSGIISVLNEKMSCFAHRPQLLEKMCINSNIELKEKNQVILFTNINQECFYNTILEIIMSQTMDNIIKKKIKYNFILDNFNTLMNKKEFCNKLNYSLSNNVETIVGVRNIEHINNKDLFKVM